MASKVQRERREHFKHYKEDVQREGKPFFPYAVFHDTMMALIVVCVIIALAVIWRESALDASPEGTEAGVLGPLYTEKADPATTSFIPRPDWFFYFLFYLLRIFKWPESVILGTVGIPTILLILLIALPFYDRSSERRILRRPVAIVAAVLTAISMGVLTYKGATARESLGSELIEAGTPEKWAQEQGFAGNQAAEAGALLFAQSGCLNCHVYQGEGSGILGAPDLSEVGRTKDQSYFVAYVSNPAQFGNTVMGSYAYLGEENLNNMGAFLAASDGE